MQKAGQPWAVSEPAQAAGIAALKADGFQEKPSVWYRREGLPEKGAGDLGFHVLDGQANYLCFRQRETTLRNVF